MAARVQPHENVAFLGLKVVGLLLEVCQPCPRCPKDAAVDSTLEVPLWIVGSSQLKMRRSAECAFEGHILVEQGEPLQRTW